MASDRIVEFNSASDEEIAYLRLLLRRVIGRLNAPWRLRREGDAHADLLIIHDHAIDAPASTQRFVRVIDSVFGAGSMQRLSWPIDKEALIRLLNGHVPVTVLEPQPVQPVGAKHAELSGSIQHSIYDELFEEDAHEAWHSPSSFELDGLEAFDISTSSEHRRREQAMIDAAESVFRVRPSPQDTLRTIALDETVGVEATTGRTDAGGNRNEKRSALVDLAVPSGLALQSDDNIASLMEFLGPRLLSGPAQILIDDIALTLDPRRATFYAKGSLSVFEECCRHHIRRSDWRELGVHEFAQISATLVARPYTELMWLSAYANHAQLRIGDRQAVRLSHGLTDTGYRTAERVIGELRVGCTVLSAAASTRVTVEETRRVFAGFEQLGWLVPV